MNQNETKTSQAGTSHLMKLAEANMNIRKAELLDGGTGKFQDLIDEAKAEHAAIKEQRDSEREAKFAATQKAEANVSQRGNDGILTLSELRDVLFEIVVAESQNGNEWVSKDKVHIVKEFKYGKIISTAGVTGAKMVEENGARYITLTTTN